jgi:phosphoribosyl-ATP pyrophosphohydrolase/phosphoribosyl-AMP cyclohydrolase/histidinol dehydrogenase
MHGFSRVFAQALAAALVSDRPDGLVPTVVVDEDMVSLGLCYSNKESLEEAIKRRIGVYWRCILGNVFTPCL